MSSLSNLILLLFVCKCCSVKQNQKQEVLNNPDFEATGNASLMLQMTRKPLSTHKFVRTKQTTRFTNVPTTAARIPRDQHGLPGSSDPEGVGDSNVDGLRVTRQYLMPTTKSSSLRAKSPTASENDEVNIRLIVWEWKEVGVFITFAIFVFAVGFAKVAFHHTHFLEAYFPETFLMLALGAAVGFILYVLGYRMPLDLEPVENKNETPEQEGEEDVGPKSNVNVTVSDSLSFPYFSPRLYFLVLIPPIILEQSYALYDSEFAKSIYPILLFSIVGKLMTTFSIGPILHEMSVLNAFSSLPSAKNASTVLSWADSLVFASIISAVDPVPVLGLLHEAGVNKHLYFLIFGESLLNDAVSVSQHSSLVVFTGPVKASGSQYGMAILMFLVDSLGGFTIGVVFGLVSALATRTTAHHRIVEPLTLLGLAYISYLLAEGLRFSGHICLIGCGLLQAHYAFKNISHTSYVSTVHFVKMLSSTADAVILLFLGMAMISSPHVWHTGFVLWTLLLCFLCRVVSVYFLSLVHNSTGSTWITLRDQTVLAYCGLRGALCLCLAHMLNESRVPQKQLFVTTTLVVILFTTLVQGGTLKLLLSCLRIRREDHAERTLNEGVAESVFSSVLDGAEAIAKIHEQGIVRMLLSRFEEKFLKKIFLSEKSENEVHKAMHKSIKLMVPISSRAPVRKENHNDFKTVALLDKAVAHTELPWNQAQGRNGKIKHSRQRKRKKVQFNDGEKDRHLMHVHNEVDGSMVIELHDVIPSVVNNEGQKLFIAHVKRNSAEERLQKMILDRTRGPQDLPPVRVAFQEKPN